MNDLIGEKQREASFLGQDILETIPVGILVTDAQGVILYVNTGMEKLLGMPKVKIQGGQISGILDEGFHLAYKKAEYTMQPVYYERTRSSGDENCQLWVLAPRGKHDVFCGMTCTVEDVTEQKKTQKKLDKIVELERMILDSLPHPAMIINQKREVIASNKKALDVGAFIGDYCWRKFGKSEYITRKDKERCAKGDMEGIKCTFCLADEAVEKKTSTNNPEVRAFNKIWDIYWKYIDIDEEGNRLYLHYAVDVTEFRRQEEKIKKARDEYLSITDLTGDIIVKTDRNGRWVFLNDGACKFWGRSRKELMGKSFVDFLHIGDLGKTAGVVQKIQGGKKVKGLVNRQKTPAGWRVVEWNGAPIYNQNGEYSGVQTTGRDITERINSEKRLGEQKTALEQKNIALNEVLGQVELEKKRIQDEVIANVENFIMPITQKLRLKGVSQKYVGLLRKNLEGLTDSFGRKLTQRKAKLTSREIEVANMIREGLSSKEIAELLNISIRTAEKHRSNIRYKLGIINKEINLTSYLKTL